MVKPEYSAGFHFVNNTSNLTLDRRERRAIKSHATKARGNRRAAPQLHSWIDPGRKLVPVKESGLLKTSSPSITSPSRISGDFSALELPPGIETTMIQDLVKLIHLHKQGGYPYEICFKVHVVERGWFPYMISDICCIHSMMFSVRALVDKASPGDRTTHSAAFHHDQTLRLLQARLDAFQRGQRDLLFCDSTIMAISTLAEAAQLTGDVAAAESHIDGLLKIVSLRGGIRSLNTKNNMHVKVCRADLGLALRLGLRPRLFREDVTWDCYIANRGVIRCSHEPHDAQIHPFVNALDTKLADCWKDLHAFSCLSNIAYQTTRRLSTETYNEMMISILYRLVHLCCKNDLLQETIRIGLLTYSSSLFMMRAYKKQYYGHLFKLFGISLFELCQTIGIVIPKPIMLWLMTLYYMVAYEGPSSEDLLRNFVQPTAFETWPQARELLKSVMWVDFVHDAPGKKAFEEGMQGLGELEAAGD